MYARSRPATGSSSTGAGAGAGAGGTNVASREGAAGPAGSSTTAASGSGRQDATSSSATGGSGSTGAAGAGSRSGIGAQGKEVGPSPAAPSGSSAGPSSSANKPGSAVGAKPSTTGPAPPTSSSTSSTSSSFRPGYPLGPSRDSSESARQRSESASGAGGSVPSGGFSYGSHFSPFYGPSSSSSTSALGGASGATGSLTPAEKAREREREMERERAAERDRIERQRAENQRMMVAERERDLKYRKWQADQFEKKSSGTGGLGSSAPTAGRDDPAGRFKTPTALLPSPRAVPGAVKPLSNNLGTSTAEGVSTSSPTPLGLNKPGGSSTGLAPASTSTSATTPGTSARPLGSLTPGGFNPLTSRTLPSPFGDRLGSASGTGAGGASPATPGSATPATAGTPGIKVDGPPPSAPSTTGTPVSGGMKLSSLLGPGGSVQTEKPGAPGPGSSISPRPTGAIPSAASSAATAAAARIEAHTRPYGFLGSQPQMGAFAYERAMERHRERNRLRDSEKDRERERELLGGAAATGLATRERSGSASSVQQGAAGRPGSLQPSATTVLPGGGAGAYPSSAAFEAGSTAASRERDRERERTYGFGSGGATAKPPAARTGYEYPLSTLELERERERERDRDRSRDEGGAGRHGGPLGSGILDRYRDPRERERQREAERERERKSQQEALAKERHRIRLELLEGERMREVEKKDLAKLERERRELFEREDQDRRTPMGASRNRGLYGAPPSRTAFGSGYGGSAGGSTPLPHRRSPSGGPAAGASGNVGASGQSYLDAMREKNEKERQDSIAAGARRQMELERTSFYERGNMFRPRPAPSQIPGRETPPDQGQGRSNSKQAIEVLNRPPSPVPPTAHNASQPFSAAHPGSVGPTGPATIAYPGLSEVTPKPIMMSPPRNMAGQGRTSSKEQPAPLLNNAGLPMPTSAAPTKSHSASHKRKRSQAYPADSVGIDAEKMDVDEEPKATGKKRNGKTSAPREQRELLATTPYNPHPAQTVDYHALTIPPTAMLDVRSEAVETNLRALGMKPLLRLLGKETYRGINWLLDAQLLANNIGSVMHVLVPGQYLPSPPSGATAWTMRGEKTWTDAVSDIGAKAIATIPGVKQARVWGTDVYTDDSDLLAVLFHSSWLRPISSAWTPERDANGDVVEPAKRVKRTQDDLRVLIRVAPKLLRYVASERASFVSRGWGNSHDGVSYVIEKVDRVVAATPVRYSRRNAKLRMAANLLQRRLVFGHLCDASGSSTWPAQGVQGLEIDAEFDDGLDDFAVDSSLKFMRSGHVGTAYQPSLLRSWHLPLEGEIEHVASPPGQAEGMGVSSEGGIKKNIWIRDLILESGNETYRLQSSPEASTINPSFRLISIAVASTSDLKRPEKAPADSDESQKPSAVPKETLVIDGLRIGDVEFTDAGLLVRKKVAAGDMDRVEDSEKAPEEEKEGWLVLLDKFAWVEKAKIASAMPTA